jgi:hypothetical protein
MIRTWPVSAMTRSDTRHKSAVALILIDVINDFDFPDGARFLRNALPVAPKMVRLKERARRAGIPAIYVNDNFGQWRSEASKLVEYCLRPKAAGRHFVESIRPDPEDYFVLKPMHSAFFQTPLEVLLRYLGASSLILCGVATNSCISLHCARRKHARFSPLGTVPIAAPRELIANTVRQSGMSKRWRTLGLWSPRYSASTRCDSRPRVKGDFVVRGSSVIAASLEKRWKKVRINSQPCLPHRL